LSVKLSLQIKKCKQALLSHGVSSGKYISLQLSPLLYIVSLVGFFLHFPWLDSVTAGIVLLSPGIVLGKKIAHTMERVGIDTAANAGRVASNIMWLGIGAGIFMVANVILGLIIRSVGSDLPV
jgi:hypothetical protein